MLSENLLGQRVLFFTNALNVDLCKDGIMLNALKPELQTQVLIQGCLINPHIESSFNLLLRTLTNKHSIITLYSYSK